MKFLLTNDDGIEAPGLAALAEAVGGRGAATVVAPDTVHSGCGHRTTTDRPLGLEQRRPGWFATDGTPADCTRLGLLHVAPEVDWVLAGVNDGGNLGVDTYMSGTVAAVREAAWLGKRAIAFSQYRRRKTADPWRATVGMVRRVLDALLERPLPPGCLWNVNLPDPEHAAEEVRLVDCPLEAGHLAIDFDVTEGRYLYRSRYHERPHRDGTDVAVCFGGHVAVTLVRPFAE